MAPASCPGRKGRRRCHTGRALEKEDLTALPLPVVQDPRDDQLPQIRGGQRVQRGPLGPDQIPGQRIDTDLRETRRLALGGEQLQHRLPVGAGRAQVRADQDVTAEGVAQVRLDRADFRGRMHPQPPAQAHRGSAAGQGQREHPAAGPGPEGPGLAVAADGGGTGAAAGWDDQSRAAGRRQQEEVLFAGARGPAAGPSETTDGGGHSTAETSSTRDRPASGAVSEAVTA